MNTRFVRRPSLLRGALFANALFSGMSGLVLVTLARPVTIFLGWSNPGAVVGLGLGLLIFAGLVWRTARSPHPGTAAVLGITVADAGWVALSLVALLTPVIPLSSEGKWAVGLVADAVGSFAVLQLLGLRRRITGAAPRRDSGHPAIKRRVPRLNSDQ